MTKTFTEMLDDYKNRKHRDQLGIGYATSPAAAERIVRYIIDHGQYGKDEGQPAFWIVPDETEEPPR